MMAEAQGTESIYSTEEKVFEDPEKQTLPLTPVNANEDVEKAEKGTTQSTALDWDGPNDPGNPLNWPKWKRIYHVIPPAFISFSATLGSSIYTPAFPTIERDWNVSSTVALLPLTFYVLALGFGPVLAAPMSEMHGRHIVYIISVPVAALFTMGTGFSQDIWTLCILRFFSGLAFSPALALGAGSIADVNKPEHRATPSAIYILAPFLGPALGPVIGSFVTVRKSWRWTQWTIIFFAIFSFILTLFTNETYKKTILARRAKRPGIAPAPSPLPPGTSKLWFLLTITLFRPVHMLITEPIVAFLGIYVSFNFAVLFAFFAAFPLVFGEVYNFSVETSGLVFLAVGVGNLISIPTVLVCDWYLYQPRVRKSKEEGRGGVVAPEYRLYPAMMGSVGLPIGLFWFAWTARSDISWASPVVAAVPFAWGNLCIFVSAANYLIDTYQALNGASALAANGLSRYTLGAVFPLFTIQMYHRLGIHWATSLLAFISLAMLPVPWVLFQYGKGIRARSGYDTLKV